MYLAYITIRLRYTRQRVAPCCTARRHAAPRSSVRNCLASCCVAAPDQVWTRL